MNYKNFPLFFGQITIDLVFLPEKRTMYKSLGIDPTDWPFIKAREYAIEYLKLVETRGQDFAQFAMTEKVEGLTGVTLPQEAVEFKCMYQEYLTYSQALELAEALKRTPSKAQEYVQKFQLKGAKGSKLYSLRDSIQEVLSRHEKKIEEGSVVVEIPDWPILSRAIGGFNPGRVSLVVAGTGFGKTTLAINLALSAIKKMAVLYFNMEMNIDDIVTKCIQAKTETDFRDWAKGQIDYEKLGDAVDGLKKNENFLFTDGSTLTLAQIVAITTYQNTKRQLGLVVVDYDQKIGAAGYQDEWRSLQKAVEELEEMAKRLNIHVMVLAQGNDNGDPKASKRAKQPAATVLHFKQEKGMFQIQAVKNRFGKRDATIQAEFIGSKSYIREVQEINGNEERPYGGTSHTGRGSYPKRRF